MDTNVHGTWEPQTTVELWDDSGDLKEFVLTRGDRTSSVRVQSYRDGRHEMWGWNLDVDRGVFRRKGRFWTCEDALDDAVYMFEQGDRDPEFEVEVHRDGTNVKHIEVREGRQKASIRMACLNGKWGYWFEPTTAIYFPVEHKFPTSEAALEDAVRQCEQSWINPWRTAWRRDPSG